MHKVILFWTLLLALAPLQAEQREQVPAPRESWQLLVRESPYWVSQGVYDNLVTIRRWVLSGESFCEREDRHILFDRRARFLGYVSNAEDPAATQRLLNRKRAELMREGRVEDWVLGEPGRAGYPFALACRQPDADLNLSIARYTGVDESARLWGTWDGMRIGEPEAPVSLHQAIALVYEDRVSRGRITLPPEVLSTLAGKVLIESGGRRGAHSVADARGVMQLSPQALADCELEERFHFHRMAQIDCALRLLEQNHRNLRPAFDTVFGHLPDDKAERLYAMLLIQAYHGGVGRVTRLLTDPEINGAARYFARHHGNFSAGDIALGMIFHNLGREQLGFASLYYATDVGIATQAVCRSTADLPGCPER